MKEKGQAILILILVMTVALSIGLSMIQRSLVDVSTASKVEQSSRAFSAAEAGIEKALQPGSSCGNNCVSFDNSSKADVSGVDLIPVVPTSGIRQAVLEYPPLAKEDVVQVWLADYASSNSNPPPIRYAQNTLDVYWGNNSGTDKAALELTLVYYGTDPQDPVVSERNVQKYRSHKWYLDYTGLVRTPDNKFDNASTCNGSSTYTCKKVLNFSANEAAGLMLLRARLLYNSTSQPIAVQAVGTCGIACSLPAQAKWITATGKSGETQRKVRVFQLKNVVPPFFDYAIFSAGEITK